MPKKMLKELLEPPAHRLGFHMKDPLVSFLCPTFGRAAKQPDVMNEAVYWFTKQTYSNRELVVLNSAPDQELVCDLPDVRVINWPYPIETLGEKMNLLVLLAAGSICLPYEDDDISLPCRASQAVAMLAEYEYWTPGLWWYAEEGKTPKADGAGVGHTSGAFRRSAFINAYPKVTKAHDMIVHDWALKNLTCNPKKVKDSRDICFFYRWGVSQIHISAQPDPDSLFKTMSAGPPGTYELKPVMGRDYQAIHDSLVKEDDEGELKVMHVQ